MKVLLSIKPQFADRIFDGTKHFEFRRSIFKEDVSTIVVYASSPTRKIIGEFEIEEIIEDTPQNIWLKTKVYAGVSRELFFNYFVGKEVGYAIKVGKMKKYKVPKCIREDYGLIPPQSFVYLDNKEE